jgi:hypothetical protein
MEPYYCLVIGMGRCKKPHPTIDLARAEARRLYLLQDGKSDVHILETMEVIKAPKVAE